MNRILFQRSDGQAEAYLIDDKGLLFDHVPQVFPDGQVELAHGSCPI